MKSPVHAVLRALDWLDAPDDPRRPSYDPVHFGAVLLLVLAAAGALFWLLWTLLVFEGGLFPKLSALACVAFTSKTLADYGYKGQPYAMGVFEGWLGNAFALVFLIAGIAGLGRLYAKAARRRR